MIKPITYRQVYNSKGDFDHLEIWQGDQHVCLNFHGQGTTYSGLRWDEIKDTIENMQTRVRATAAEDLVKGAPFWVNQQ